MNKNVVIKLCFRLILKYNRSARSVTGEIIHNSGLVVVTASTNEWAISKYLYRLVLLFTFLEMLVHVNRFLDLFSLA